VGLADTGLDEPGVGVVAGEGLAATGAKAEGRGPLVVGSGLAVQGEIEHVFGEQFADLEEEVFDGGQGGSPRRAIGPVELVDEVFGDAFDVGADFFHLGRAFLGASHPRDSLSLAAKARTNFLPPV
jgi:hypothetical protein